MKIHGREPSVIKHLGWNDVLGLVALGLAIIAIAKARGLGDKAAAVLAAFAGVVLAATGPGLAIHAAILRAFHIAAPDPYSLINTNFSALGWIMVVALVILVLIAKGSRTFVVVAFLGFLLFVASTGLGQWVYNVVVGH